MIVEEATLYSLASVPLEHQLLYTSGPETLVNQCGRSVTSVADDTKKYAEWQYHLACQRLQVDCNSELFIIVVAAIIGPGRLAALVALTAIYLHVPAPKCRATILLRRQFIFHLSIVNLAPYAMMMMMMGKLLLLSFYLCFFHATSSVHAASSVHRHKPSEIQKCCYCCRSDDSIKLYGRNNTMQFMSQQL